MDKTDLVQRVFELFSLTGYKTRTSVQINHREIDVVAEELQGLVRKTVLIECADYASPVGVEKITSDFQKLSAAKEKLGHKSVLMHISRSGYSQHAEGYAFEHGLDILTFSELSNRLINFDPYITAIEQDPVREVILSEYQPTKIHYEGERSASRPAVQFLDHWLGSDIPWLTILGDYGVGKSWMLKRYLFHLLEIYKQDPTNHPLPFFVPLQQFTKAFDYTNLILASFQKYQLGGVHYPAFEYLANAGRVVFLLDSFDEMAQMLRAETIRSNLRELLAGVSNNSKAIMTSRPTYFESRAERLIVVEREGALVWHPLDSQEHQTETALSRFITTRLDQSKFARLSDLTTEQRLALFRTVLEGKPAAHAKLTDLFRRFQNLETISQKAVIARLLTTVAETLAASSSEDNALLPSDVESLNEGKIFQIVVHNLLQRDVNIGLLTTSDRMRWLRSFAVHLQGRGRSFFAETDEVRKLVEVLFANYLRSTDTPQQLLENYYRTCRRHSGLTTEGQFLDNSGRIDSPIDERDTDSRVGFSHNSIREFLVADALADSLVHETTYPGLENVVVTETVGGFFDDLASYETILYDKLRTAYNDQVSSKMHEVLFTLCFELVRRQASRMELLGTPPNLSEIDLCNRDLSGWDLRGSNVENSVIGDTDFRNADLRNASFGNSIIAGTMFDGAKLQGADFSTAQLDSVYVYDEYDKRTTAMLRGRDARQWLWSRGALVSRTDDLNPFLGRPWYEAAREVMRTLEKRIAGTHQDVSLVKGIDHSYREFAWEFVNYLVKVGIIRRVGKADHGGEWIIKAEKDHYPIIHEFSEHGTIRTILKPFFDKRLSAETQKR